MKTGNYLIATAIIFLFGATSCKKAVLVKFSGNTQGTTYSISYYEDNGKNYQKEIDSLLKSFDKTASIYDSTSIISKINDNKPVEVNRDFTSIFNRSMQVSAETDGAFDITVGPLVNAFGFGAKNEHIIDSAKIDSLRKIVGYKKVRISGNKVIKDDPRMQLDFNAIAQGYSVDMVAKFLESKDIHNFLVEIGGEVIGKGLKEGGKNWVVGIEKPVDNNENRDLEAKAKLIDRALTTAGNYRKFYIENGIRYSHTIDPHTGYPAKHSLLSASVFASNCTDADAYDTAFMVMGLEKTKAFLEKHKELDAYLIYSDEKGNLKTYETEGLKNIVEETK
jgi:FAD:protein FMN transferase